ncbi:DUF4183 domain-containing protein [Bacillus wiedmannii]|uniref:DUF4183 domain-containing protein n=1 Tax=Bacillus wiedmannii TaxID=1890302 RepID=UPI000BF1A93B|nr:DUF4183 domain-containing protein [Bacillus wiedmannii]MCU5685834.1 DUF4183 domain-containing protein [Bacillus wiedmannii]MDP1456030.1 DUF4183 domain-containing protein [Bacillus wiedmannii]MED2011441.1 DUF4183 domain-containing protein [Bacillus wiedmannii]PEJ72878.1 hypothetical protein CN685_11895 [Bacillus wiedmannii]TKH03175.1 DUF4183 domain-containing protein [Bacillus wiedmannii]
MPIIQPFMASRRFTSTLGAGTGAAFAIAATACLNDAGTTATAFPTFTYYNFYVNGILQPSVNSSITTGPTGAITMPGGGALDGGIPITIEFIVT